MGSGSTAQETKMAKETGDMSTEGIKQAASESMGSKENIRERVRELTLQALQQRKFDYAGFREVMTAMTEGISLGAERRGQDVKHALSEAFTGMDQALTKAAQASSLALTELASKGRDFSDRELKQALDQMKQMESDFLDSIKKVAGTTGGAVKTGWDDLIAHAQRAGTDTGAVVSQTMREFSHRMATTMAESTLAGMEAARQAGERFAQVASGILSGMAEAIKPGKEGQRKP
jgi:hypothetical protein